MAPRLKDPDRNKLIAGPYHPPRTRAGRFLACELRGKVQVRDFSDAPIPWPMGSDKPVRPTIIVCGDLVRALRVESLTAVSYHWGVCHSVVSKWRTALGVERMNSGTTRLLRWAVSDAMTPAVRRKLSAAAKGRKVLRTPEERERWLKRLRAGWTPRVRTRAAERMRRCMLRIKGRLGPVPNAWKPEEDRLLGTRPDREVAKLVGRSQFGVAQRRERLGIRSFYQQRSLASWTAEEDELLRSKADKTIAKLLRRSVRSVRARRRLKGIRRAAPHYRPWTPEEDKLLGTMPDAEVGRRVGRSATAATARRFDLGISLSQPVFRPWTAAEEKLLGTQPDSAVAELIHRSTEAVQVRRRALSIPGPGPSGHVSPWTLEEEALLGRKPDREVARLTGRTLTAVQGRRNQKKIAPVAARTKPFTDAELALLGTKSDVELAQMFLRCATTVSKKRRSLKIPAFPRPGKFVPSSLQVDNLPKAPPKPGQQEMALI